MSRVKLIELDLSRESGCTELIEGYTRAQVQLRWCGQPLGVVEAPIENGWLGIAELRRAILDEHGKSIVRHLIRRMLDEPPPCWSFSRLFVPTAPLIAQRSLPTISLAVCTRDRPASLERCLHSIEKLDHPPCQVLVIDNAPATDETRRLLNQNFPQFKYVMEPRPGLDWARNCAIAEATGEILAYTDDDVVVDPGWTLALARTFADQQVMAVTGLVMPLELETEPQSWFEQLGGFGRGFDRRWYRAATGKRIAWFHGGSGKFGTGANMAFRRDIFDKIGGFDPALDVGTVTQGGGDLEMFFRLLKHGQTLVYEPAAMVRHQHRRDYKSLQYQISSNGVGLFSYFVRSVREYPQELPGFLRLSWWFLWTWNLRRIIRSYLRPLQIPRQLFWSELRGCFSGLFRYRKAAQRASALICEFGPGAIPTTVPKPVRTRKSIRPGKRVGIRTVDLNELNDLADVSEYAQVRIYVFFNGRVLGLLEIANEYCTISSNEIRDEIARKLGGEILHLMEGLPVKECWEKALTALSTHVAQVIPKQVQSKRAASPRDAVSIIVATCDRPEDLRQCLSSLIAQTTTRVVEIIVVDNNPESGLTPPVVREFPGVRLISEKRRGLSYARNLGFLSALGSILVATDDDVRVPPDWLEKLIAPFSRADVMIVTGGVFPAELETEAQIQFEKYGGLGRGFDRIGRGLDWFNSFGRRAVPTWELGATANAAIRKSALAHQDIGLLEEALGAGTPTGCSEDTYLFYRVLKAGYTIVYEPSACVWHKHRRTSRELRRQLYNYAKGHAAYNLTTFLNDGDWRGLTRICVEIPIYFGRCFCEWISGASQLPLSLILTQMAGHVAAPFALWRAWRRVRRLGRSAAFATGSNPKSGISEEVDPVGPKTICCETQ